MSNNPHATAGLDDCITSNSGYRNTADALSLYVAPPTTQGFFAPPTTAATIGLLSFDDVRSVEVQTGCGPNDTYIALMRYNGDMLRACEYTRNCMLSGCMAALGGGAPLVTPHINFRWEGGSKSSLLTDTSNAAGLVVFKAFWLKNLPSVPLERPDPNSKRMNRPRYGRVRRFRAQEKARPRAIPSARRPGLLDS